MSSNLSWELWTIPFPVLAEQQRWVKECLPSWGEAGLGRRGLF